MGFPKGACIPLCNILISVGGSIPDREMASFNVKSDTCPRGNTE